MWTRFIYDNTDFDEATLSASSATSGLPVTNVQNQRRKQVWRSTGVTSEYIDVDFGGVVTINCCAILNNNFSATATVTITAGTTSGGSDICSYSFSGFPDTMSFGANLFGEAGFGGYLTPEQVEQLTVDQMCMAWLDSTYTARYWRIKVEDSANSDGYIQMGRVFLSAYYEPALMPSGPLTFSIKDPSIIKRSLGGQKWTDELDRYRTLQLTWNNMDAGSWDMLQTMIATVGIREDFIVDIVLTDSAGQDLWFGALYGRLTAPPNLVVNNVLYGTNTLVIEESL